MVCVRARAWRWWGNNKKLFIQCCADRFMVHSVNVQNFWNKPMITLNLLLIILWTLSQFSIWIKLRYHWSLTSLLKMSGIYDICHLWELLCKPIWFGSFIKEIVPLCAYHHLKSSKEHLLRLLWAKQNFS